ncbi:B2 bradykinin receptor-like [Cololabis saira]|uniref:B2 bradykinin receptor-like n=1 Tax=Cololabis saira TaxID=129043 RepID=UPI002AD4DB92|nr:B2 bradykinin receptor-like [Cololabis saira]
MSISANLSMMSGNQTQGNNTNCKLYHDDRTFQVVPVYILVIAVLGIVLNVFVLMVFCLHKKACTVPEIYLSNLAAADLVLVSCLPFWVVNVSRKFVWTFDESLCKIVNVGIVMNAYCSIYFLVLVSIDRYMALVHPMTQMRMRRPSYAKLGCLLVWGLGFLLSLPSLIFRKLGFEGNVTRCYIDYPKNTYVLFELMLFIFSFCIPIAIISFCTIKIIKVLTNRLIEGLESQNTDQKATTLLLAVLLAFLICWVPFHLTKMPTILSKMGIITKCSVLYVLLICRQTFTYFAFFNSVLNPILYVIVGKNFRKKTKELFKQRSVRKSTSRFTSARSYLSRSTTTTQLKT